MSALDIRKLEREKALHLYREAVVSRVVIECDPRWEQTSSRSVLRRLKERCRAAEDHEALCLAGVLALFARADAEGSVPG